MRFISYKGSGFRKNKNASPAPVGTIIAFASASAPGGWLACQGQTLSTTTNPQYTNLYSIIGTTYGGTSASSFNLPDLRGRVPVGAGTGSGGTSFFNTLSIASGTGAISSHQALTARARTDATGGVENHPLTAAQSGLPAHGHPVTESAHTHSLTADSHSHAMGWSAQTMTTSSNTGVYAPPTAPYYSTTTNTPSTTPTFTVSSPSSGVTDGSGNANRTAVYGVDAVNSHSNVQPSLVMAYIIKI